MSSYKSETADIHSANTSVLPRLVWSMADSLAFRICISVVSRYTYMTIDCATTVEEGNFLRQISSISKHVSSFYSARVSLSLRDALSLRKVRESRFVEQIYIKKGVTLITLKNKLRR